MDVRAEVGDVVCVLAEDVDERSAFKSLEAMGSLIDAVVWDPKDIISVSDLVRPGPEVETAVYVDNASDPDRQRQMGEPRFPPRRVRWNRQGASRIRGVALRFCWQRRGLKTLSLRLAVDSSSFWCSFFSKQATRSCRRSPSSKSLFMTPITQLS